MREVLLWDAVGFLRVLRKRKAVREGKQASTELHAEGDEALDYGSRFIMRLDTGVKEEPAAEDPRVEAPGTTC